MKIAFILPSIANRGPIVFTKYLIDGLKAKVENIVVYYFNETKNPINLGVPTKKISFFEKIDFSHFDIIHSTMLKPDLYLYYHRRSIGKKAVSSLHNMIKEDLKFNYKPFKRFVYQVIWKKILSRETLPLIVSSSEMLQYYKNFLKRETLINVIPYGVTKGDLQEIELEEKKKLIELRKRYTIIGSVGLLIKRKGFEQLVEFLKINKEYAIVIIGEGPEKDNLYNLSKELNVSDRVIFLGFKDNSYNYYPYFDIYALVSYSEGFGLAMLEAMAWNLPIVCTDLPIYNDYFDSSQVGLFKSGDIQSLSKTIEKVNNNKKQYSDASRKLFEEEFSSSVMGDRHIDFYKKNIK